MPSPRKYEAPSIAALGSVADITKQGGGNFIDVPQGTPTTPDTTIGDVTGKEPFQADSL